MKFSYKAGKDNENVRVDVFLNEKIKKASRTKIQESIKMGNLKINGHLVKKASETIKAGDKVDFQYKTAKSNKLENINPHKIAFKTIFKNKNLVVVNKPTGVSVHPSRSEKDGTLLNGLVYRYKKLLKVGKIPKLGLVHRLDKNTSGVLLVALNNEALWYFSRQFEQRKVDKYYLAVVFGNARKIFRDKRMKTVSNYIARDPINRKRMAVVSKNKGKIATTKFIHLQTNDHKELGEISFILAKLLTGRTHQIRVHLKHINLPIVGDEKYGKHKLNTQFSLMLHAYKLGICLLNKKRKYFVAEIPTRIKEIVNTNKIENSIEKHEQYF